MDHRPIGIFDSGLGGLTAQRVLAELLPGEDIIYFGDTRRMPYGGRTLREIEHLAKSDADFLGSFGVKAILVACGTISSNAMDYLADNFSIPFFGVVASACSQAVKLSSGRIGVIATEASIRSGSYERTLRSLSPDVEVVSCACPGFVPLVESGRTKVGDSLAEATVARELAGIKAAGVDTLILGCTHFPMLEELISGYLGELNMVSAGAEAAKGLAAYLKEKDMLSEKAEGGARKWYTSGNAETFEAAAARFLGRQIQAEQHIVD